MMSTRLYFRLSLFVALMVVCCASAGSTLGDWPQFRGLNSSGVAEGVSPPVEFGPGKNELWHVPIGSGHSSPCVVGDSIFLTTYDKKDKKLEVLRLARADGKVIWRRAISAGRIETGHPSFNPASCTPTSDGERVVAYFGSFGLICFDLKGEKLWQIKMPLARSYSGNATSPIIVGDRVILYRANHIDHFLLAVDKKTGKELWKKPQRERFTSAMAAAATPVLVGKTLIVHGVQAVKAFEIADGKLLWQANCSTTATSTPVFAGDEVIIATWNQTGEPALTPVFPPFDKLLAGNDKDGNGLITPNEFPKLMYFARSEGAEAPQNGAPLRFSHVDSNKNGKIEAEEWRKTLTSTAERRKRYIPHGLVAIKVDSNGELKSSQIRYLERVSIPEVPSPIVHDGRVYFVKNGGILTCLNLKTGRRVYRMRTGGTGTHYASPIIAGSNLFTTSGDGQISVIRLGAEPKILATNEMPEKTYATPAIVDGVLYVRTHTALYAFKSKK
jgi:outer membrane protein assembly factor BamB